MYFYLEQNIEQVEWEKKVISGQKYIKKQAQWLNVIIVTQFTKTHLTYLNAINAS